MKKKLQIVIAILGCEAVGILGSFTTFSAIPTWYIFLNKPFFSPPNWIFGPVWTILYALMGISVFLIWQKGIKNKINREAVTLFVIQLILNGIWTPIFFGLKNLFLALIVIVAMLYFIYQTISAFSKIDKKAAYLLYPYMAWVSFATLLNFSVWILNR